MEYQTYMRFLRFAIIFLIGTLVGHFFIKAAKADTWIIQRESDMLPIIIQDSPHGYYGYDYNTNNHIEIIERLDGSYQVYEGYDSPPSTIKRFGGGIEENFDINR